MHTRCTTYAYQAMLGQCSIQPVIYAQLPCLCRNGVMYVSMKSSTAAPTPVSLDGISPKTVAENSFLARISPVNEQEVSGRDLRSARDRHVPCFLSISTCWQQQQSGHCNLRSHAARPAVPLTLSALLTLPELVFRAQVAAPAE